MLGRSRRFFPFLALNRRRFRSDKKSCKIGRATKAREPIKRLFDSTLVNHSRAELSLSYPGSLWHLNHSRWRSRSDFAVTESGQSQSDSPDFSPLSLSKKSNKILCSFGRDLCLRVKVNKRHWTSTHVTSFPSKSVKLWRDSWPLTTAVRHFFRHQRRRGPNERADPSWLNN